MTHPNRMHWFWLLLVPAVFAGPDSTLGAEPQRTRGARPSGLDKGLTHSEARSVNHVLDARLVDADWPARLTDGDDASGLVVADLPAGALTIRYAGAAEWTNEIEVRYRGEGTVVVDLLLPHDRWVREAVRLDLPAAPQWTTMQISVAADRYQGLALDFGSPPGLPPLAVSEVGAYWFEPELTRDTAETADEWCENYPGTGNDLSSPNETAQRFSDYLADEGWTWIFDFGDANAWEEDFKRVDLGGTNNSWIDATDAFIYCGHGTTDATFMADTSHDDTNVTAADIDGAWGNGDLEWAWFHCCLNMSSTAWANALAGAHTISGAINVINGSSNWGKTIAQKLIDNGAFDSAWSIYSAWWHSNDSNQPAGNKFRLLAEDYDHYNENIWGQGTVLPDSPDATHWTVSQTVSKVAGGRDVFDPAAVQRTSEPVAWSAPPELGDPGRPALEVRVYPEVLQKQLPQVAWILDVPPSGLNDVQTVQTFERLCSALDLDCGDVAVGREGADGYAAASGLANLSGDIASGGWQFTNLELHTVPERAPDVAIGPGQAAERARSFLQSLDLIDQNSFLADVNVFEAAEEDSNGQTLQSFPFAYDVVIGRNTGPSGASYPVVGNGGCSHVAVGVDGAIQAFNQVSRRVQPRTPVEVISVQTALSQLAAFGYANLQTAPEFAAQSVEVRDINLGYFEQGISSQQSRMGPVYYMDVDLIGPDPQREGARLSVPGRIFMAADTLPVRSEILAPNDGDSFAYHQTISFRSRGVNGTPPYEFRWFSDLHGLISTQQNFSTDQLNPAFREDGTASPITIELRVTDANGFTSTDQIVLIITGVIGVDDVPQVFALAPNSPNPFNPRTTIEFAVPTAGEANLRIVDLRGRLVRTLLDESVPVGRHARTWDGTDATGRPVAAGVYLYRLDVHGDDGTLFTDTRRMVLVR
jgi:hypothetical protein